MLNRNDARYAKVGGRAGGGHRAVRRGASAGTRPPRTPFPRAHSVCTRAAPLHRPPLTHAGLSQNLPTRAVHLPPCTRRSARPRRRDAVAAAWGFEPGREPRFRPGSETHADLRKEAPRPSGPPDFASIEPSRFKHPGSVTFSSPSVSSVISVVNLPRPTAANSCKGGTHRSTHSHSRPFAPFVVAFAPEGAPSISLQPGFGLCSPW